MKDDAIKSLINFFGKEKAFKLINETQFKVNETNKLYQLYKQQ